MMSDLACLRHQNLTSRRTGADYLKLYAELKQTAQRLDNGPHDVLTRGGEVSVVEREGPEEFSLSYQRGDVIAQESLILYRKTDTPEYQATSLELGLRGEMLEVTHRHDATRDIYGDENKTVLYVDPSSGETLRPGLRA
jgi:hypothetical protein